MYIFTRARFFFRHFARIIKKLSTRDIFSRNRPVHFDSDFGFAVRRNVVHRVVLEFRVTEIPVHEDVRIVYDRRKFRGTDAATIVVTVGTQTINGRFTWCTADTASVRNDEITVDNIYL